jgi:hypothetical protein
MAVLLSHGTDCPVKLHSPNEYGIHCAVVLPTITGSTGKQEMLPANYSSAL